MKKLYYKIELRMGEWIFDTEDRNREIEEKVGELFYFSDGYIIMENNIITGFLSNDLITGDITESEIFIEILEDSEEEILYSSFANEFDSIMFPGKYLLIRQDIEENPELRNQFAIINFIEKIRDESKQKQIKEQFEKVKEIYPI